MRQRARAVFAFAAAAAVTVTAGLATASSPPSSSGPSDPAAATAGSEPAPPIAPDRCEANHAAGTITYLTGFDYAAAASMVDVFVAAEHGYYEALCLDVEIVASFSTANYPLVASGDAQFASAGSFSEVLQFAAVDDADLVAVTVEGRTPIDVLILQPGAAATLDDLAGTTIGVKGKLNTSIAAMLAGAGLTEGEDFETVLLDGFDPLVHITLDGVVGFPGYRSNEPGTLERAGTDFDLYDPTDYDVPGSFGVIYTTRSFLDEHPQAVQDFVRATMRGLADAIADPEAAAAVAMDLTTAGGNPNYLSPEGELYRWTTDAATLLASAEAGPLGVPVADLLQAEVEAYAGLGLFGDTVAGSAPASGPDFTTAVDLDLAASVYDEAGQVIWPG